MQNGRTPPANASETPISDARSAVSGDRSVRTGGLARRDARPDRDGTV
ncbi:hypothetical protein [Halorussus caseinilyticus]|nr:hypothetical protein [Halorussus sp. DT72]